MKQTMTKEQILERNGLDFDAFQLENEYSAKSILKAMSEWEQQQLSAERERAGKLVEALKDAFDEFEDLNLHRQAARIHKTLNEYDTATKES